MESEGADTDVLLVPFFLPILSNRVKFSVVSRARFSWWLLSSPSPSTCRFRHPVAGETGSDPRALPACSASSSVTPGRRVSVRLDTLLSDGEEWMDTLWGRRSSGCKAVFSCPRCPPPGDCSLRLGRASFPDESTRASHSQKRGHRRHVPATTASSSFSCGYFKPERRFCRDLATRPFMTRIMRV